MSRRRRTVVDESGAARLESSTGGILLVAAILSVAFAVYGSIRLSLRTITFTTPAPVCNCAPDLGL